MTNPVASSNASQASGETMPRIGEASGKYQVSAPIELMRGASETEGRGNTPTRWSIRAVRETGDVLTGKALAANAPGSRRPYLRTKNVLDGAIDIDDVLTMPMTDKQFEQFQIVPGDVLLNEGQSLELVGRCAIYKGEYFEPCAMQNQLLRYRARAGTCAEFAAHLFRYSQQSGVFARVALQTTSIAHLGGSRFERLALAWPDAEREQRAIAEALSDVDGLLGALDALLAKKRAIKQAAMQQLLTGKTRLPGFGGEWEKKQLGELGATYGGLTGKSKADFGTGKARYVTFMNVITNSVIDDTMFEAVRVSVSESQNRVERGDLLFNGSSETPEEVALCSLVSRDVPELYLNSFCFGFRPRDDARVNGLFLTFYIRSGEGREIMKALAQGSTRFNLSKKALLAAELRLPRLPEQEAIAECLAEMDSEIVALERRHDKTRAIKQGMMQQLLTGRVRLMRPTSATPEVATP